LSIFAIGDLHLSFGVDKPMDIFKGWENYTQLLYENWQQKVSDEDTVVICGDFSWAMTLDELKPDMEFLCSLKGKKVLLKGNHDYWWQTQKKLDNFIKENNFSNIEFLFNNTIVRENYALCGTRGWLLENKSITENDRKIINRECGRLELSLKAGEQTALPIISFMHYPPVFDNYECEGITELLKKYNVKKCFYGHIHGNGSMYSVFGEYDRIDYKLVSADNIKFSPVLVV